SADSVVNAILVQLPADVINPGDSTDSDTTDVIRYYALASDIQANQVIVCAGDSATLSVTSATVLNPVFTWYTDSALTQSLGQGNSYTIRALTTTVFYVTVKGDNALENLPGTALKATVGVKDRASNSTIIVEDTVICRNSRALLSASSTLNKPVFTWYADSLLTINVNTGNQFVTPILSQNTTYFITVQNDSLCSSVIGKKVTVTVNDCNLNGVIGVAKSVSTPRLRADGTHEVTYTIVVRNLGSINLYNIVLSDNLKRTFPLPTQFAVVGTITGTGKLVTNNAFNGTSDTVLAETGRLNINEADTIAFTVRITPNERFGPFFNTAYVRGTDSAQTLLTDDASQDGTDPDPNNDLNPIENDPTPLILTPPSPPEVFVPNGFSPNGDGLNDFLTIDNPKGYRLSLTIYNRWGNLIFEQKEYKNTWGGIAEKGIVIGEGVPDGTYYYILEYMDENSNLIERTGFITISR
ncbi:MAG: gliding motility-associated C-terminal domain-containing protein, partial [Bacteroidia bacterium]|nr:gliding motility-associated C-terminal domain-containing protein [Bacteroidia bacterium]